MINHDDYCNNREKGNLVNQETFLQDRVSYFFLGIWITWVIITEFYHSA